MTRFRDYQRLAISAALNGKDSLIIQPTGSGKSLCYQFPSHVHINTWLPFAVET
ncbi:MAG: DEAD/DEAH box helicase, partial [Alphaproteobacteria bacterium]|nr:DEAD/DEAH box helicase [Alphaproteobacteria bacterium]